MVLPQTYRKFTNGLVEFAPQSIDFCFVFIHVPGSTRYSLCLHRLDCISYFFKYSGLYVRNTDNSAFHTCRTVPLQFDEVFYLQPRRGHTHPLTLHRYRSQQMGNVERQLNELFSIGGDFLQPPFVFKYYTREQRSAMGRLTSANSHITTVSSRDALTYFPATGMKSTPGRMILRSWMVRFIPSGVGILQLFVSERSE
jgi:hypothetical protein